MYKPTPEEIEIMALRQNIRTLHIEADKMVKEATAEIKTLEKKCAELEHLLFLVATPLEMYVKGMGSLTNQTKEAAEDALLLINQTLGKE